jgi:putative transposase
VVSEVRAGLRERLRRRRPRPGGKWHPDEAFIKINGERKYPRRAVDRDGDVLDILVQDRRDKAAARRFLRGLMTRTRAAPRAIVTGRLRSCSAAHREVMPCVEHRSHKRLDNRAENSHQPTRQRERVVKGYPLRERRAEVPVRVQWHLTPLPAAPPPDART